jgi:hypothetical protein
MSGWGARVSCVVCRVCVCARSRTRAYVHACGRTGPERLLPALLEARGLLPAGLEVVQQVLELEDLEPRDRGLATLVQPLEELLAVLDGLLGRADGDEVRRPCPEFAVLELVAEGTVSVAAARVQAPPRVFLVLVVAATVVVVVVVVVVAGAVVVVAAEHVVEEGLGLARRLVARQLLLLLLLLLVLLMLLLLVVVLGDGRGRERGGDHGEAALLVPLPEPGAVDAACRGIVG